MTPETGFYNEIAPRIEAADPMQVEALLSKWSRLAELGISPQTVMARCNGDVRSINVFRAILTLYAELKAKPYSGEKTPIHRKFVPELLQGFAAARVLHIIRDGRGVAQSLLTMPWWNRSLEAAADLWLEAVDEIESLQATFSGRFLVVRYEALVERPEPVLREVMTFLGLGFEARQLDPRSPSGVVLARSLPWKGLALRQVEASRAQRWRSELTERQLTYLTARLGERLRELGYA